MIVLDTEIIRERLNVNERACNIKASAEIWIYAGNVGMEVHGMLPLTRAVQTGESGDERNLTW